MCAACVPILPPCHPWLTVSHNLSPKAQRYRAIHAAYAGLACPGAWKGPGDDE
jgi:hypothetical protein